MKYKLLYKFCWGPQFTNHAVNTDVWDDGDQSHDSVFQLGYCVRSSLSGRKACNCVSFLSPSDRLLEHFTEWIVNMVAHDYNCNSLGHEARGLFKLRSLSHPGAVHCNPISTINQRNEGINKELTGNEHGVSKKWKVWTECESTFLIPGQLWQWGLS